MSKTTPHFARILQHDYYSGVFLFIIGILSLLLSWLLLAQLFVEGPKEPPPYHWLKLTLFGLFLLLIDIMFFALWVRRVGRIWRVLAANNLFPGVVNYNFYAYNKGHVSWFHGGGQVVAEYEACDCPIICSNVIWNSDTAAALESGDKVMLSVDPKDPEFGLITELYCSK